MEYLELFFSLAGAVLSLLITSITFITKFLKSSKAKKLAENILEICNALLPLISQAEKLTNFTGEEKKEYVMTLIRQYALDKKLLFDYQKISNKVDELILLSKEVNIAKGSNQATAISNTMSLNTSNIVNQVL
jgi:hypothetical protein